MTLYHSLGGKPYWFAGADGKRHLNEYVENKPNDKYLLCGEKWVFTTTATEHCFRCIVLAKAEEH